MNLDKSNMLPCFYEVDDSILKALVMRGMDLNILQSVMDFEYLLISELTTKEFKQLIVAFKKAKMQPSFIVDHLKHLQTKQLKSIEREQIKYDNITVELVEFLST